MIPRTINAAKVIIVVISNVSMISVLPKLDQSADEGGTITRFRLIEPYRAKARKSTAIVLYLEVVMQTVAEHKFSNGSKSAREPWN